MRWWDQGVRIRVVLLALNALALAAVAEGRVRFLCGSFALLAGLSVVRSMKRGIPPLEAPLKAVPLVTGSFYLGRGFEWTLETVQETIESGRPAHRTEFPLLLPEAMLEQHVLIMGATGVGKTRLLELLALQAIARGDAVIIIDPKGDEGLLARVRRAAAERFRLFSLPHPDRSVKYNPLGRFHDVREVADRVAALLPSSGDALPFRNFAWDIVDTVARELNGKRPITFQALKRCAIDHPIKPLSDRPRDHYLKTASGLIPILSKLSSDLLCPKNGGLSWDEVDAARGVVYFELGSLLGNETSSAVAKTALLDLQSYVGARYAYSKGHGPIWLLVDEIGDVITSEFISILNKGRGAGLRVVACGQTLSDLEAALGSRARALQVVGNMSTTIQFRTQGATDAEAFADLSGERLVKTRSEASAYEPALLGSGLKWVDDFRAKFGESTTWRENDLVPPWTVLQLPVFGYFARWNGRVFRGRVPLLE
jgi:conjugal transfer pilus assembly protein TraD